MTNIGTVNEATARRAVFDYASTAAEAWTEELERFGDLWRKFNEDHFDSTLDEPHIQWARRVRPRPMASSPRLAVTASAR